MTWWAELRNSCEGVHEVQAIEYFTAGCREGTLLKHRLLLEDLKETFDNLRRFQIKLNPEKCVFGAGVSTIP